MTGDPVGNRSEDEEMGPQISRISRMWITEIPFST
jgi:hypothetical protein